MEDGQKLTKMKPCTLSHSRTIFWLLLITSFTSGILLFSYFETLRKTYQQWSYSTIPPSDKVLLKIINQKVETKTLPSPKYQSPGPYFVEYPYKYNFIINEETRCEELKPFLVLIVPTAPRNDEDRQIIRNTWGGQKEVSGRNVTLFFMLGLGKVDKNELLEESKQYRDILQGNFIDSYKNLTIKTMVMLEWLDSHCRNAAYAMKIDTDMFLNLPKLMEMLESPPKTNYLTGLVDRASVVHRHTSSKWFVPFEVLLGETFPPYAFGQGYILSLDLPRKLVEVANRDKRAFYIEDVYLGMCMQRLGLQPTDPPNLGAFPVWGPKFDRCTYSNIIATVYPRDEDKLQMWRIFTAPGPHC